MRRCRAEFGEEDGPWKLTLEPPRRREWGRLVVCRYSGAENASTVGETVRTRDVLLVVWLKNQSPPALSSLHGTVDIGERVRTARLPRGGHDPEYRGTEVVLVAESPPAYDAIVTTEVLPG